LQRKEVLHAKKRRREIENKIIKMKRIKIYTSLRGCKTEQEKENLGSLNTAGEDVMIVNESRRNIRIKGNKQQRKRG
jgi:hypothetical protein